MPLAGGPIAFTFVREGGGVLPVAEANREALIPLTAARAPWAGFALDRPLIMGIINVTPDSFSDGGDFVDPTRAVAHGRVLLDEGADLLDIGGESTRPGARPTPPEEEIARVVPVIRSLAEAGAVVSVDTRRAAVMRAALAAGARVINDVTALAGDPTSLEVAAKSDAALVLMHMRGDPATMQRQAVYSDVVDEVLDELAARIAACEAAGIARARIAIDPGLGFAKTAEHNVSILARLACFHALGHPLLVGASRKSFIARLSRGEQPKDRLPGSIASVLAALARGAQILRVHDVAATRQAVAVWEAIATGG
jgi:dihydropteroate synthase